MEVIERKGAGHPDTLADMLGEELAKLIKEEYKNQRGQYLHYNVDKVLLACGVVELRHKIVLKPVKVVFAGNYIPLQNINELMEKAVYKVMQPELEAGLSFEILNLLSSTSTDLTVNFNNRKCNDTSFAVAHPLSKAEKQVLKLGEYLDNLYITDKNIGRDNKIMYIDGKYQIALAFKAPIANKRYERKKEELRKEIAKAFKIPLKNISINGADTADLKFITLTGTSLESGDAGMTGRGNRRNGLITPMKPMTLEAYYGKNDITHIGRTYQDKAQEIANKLKKKVLLVNTIGGNIDKPTIIQIK